MDEFTDREGRGKAECVATYLWNEPMFGGGYFALRAKDPNFVEPKAIDIGKASRVCRTKMHRECGLATPGSCHYVYDEAELTKAIHEDFLTSTNAALSGFPGLWVDLYRKINTRGGFGESVERHNRKLVLLRVWRNLAE